MLAVSDTGIGMDADTTRPPLRALLHHQGAGPRHRPRALHRLTASSSRAAAIIEVYSEPGRGTSVKIYLPRVDQPALVG